MDPALAMRCTRGPGAMSWSSSFGDRAVTPVQSPAVVRCRGYRVVAAVAWEDRQLIGAMRRVRKGPSARELELGRYLGRVPSTVCRVTVMGRAEELDASKDGEECEVVQGQQVVLGEGPPGSPTTSVKADDKNKFLGYLVVPLKNSNGTGVLLLTDVLGHANKENREFAHRLACFGYTILVPDLYRGNPWDDSLPQDEFEAWRAMHAGPPGRVSQDIATAAKYLEDQLVQTQGSDESGVPKVALMGFCFGGGRVLEALAKDGGEAEKHFTTGVSFYGTRFDADSVAKEIKVPVLMIVGDEDPLCPLDSFTKVGDTVEGSEVLVYPERGHGFVHRPASMDEDDDAENAFHVARHWLHKHMLTGSPDSE